MKLWASRRGVQPDPNGCNVRPPTMAEKKRSDHAVKLIEMPLPQLLEYTATELERHKQGSSLVTELRRRAKELDYRKR